MKQKTPALHGQASLLCRSTSGGSFEKIEQNDEWLACRRYLSAESMALLDAGQDLETETEDNREEAMTLNAA
jgi:hypothetical protein